MKKNLIILVVVLLTALTHLPSSYSAEKAETVRIGVVDIQKVILESRSGRDARLQFENEMMGKKKAFADKEEVLKKLRSEMDKTGIPDAEKKEKEEKFQKEARDLRRLRDDTESVLREMDKAISGKLVSEIREVVSKLGEEGKYTIIIEKGSGLLYMPAAIDLTEKVIENYDKQKARK